MLRHILKNSSLPTQLRYYVAVKNTAVPQQQQQSQTQQQSNPSEQQNQIPTTSFDEKWNEYFDYDPFVDENTNTSKDPNKKPSTSFGE